VLSLRAKEPRTCLSNSTSPWEKRFQQSELAEGESVRCEREKIQRMRAMKNCWCRTVQKGKERGGWRQTITVLWDRERISEKAQVIVVPSLAGRNI